MQKLTTQIHAFFNRTLWLIKPNKKESPVGFYVMKGLRIALSSAFKFQQQEGFIRAASLTYFSINSLVPFLAFAIWVTARFALTDGFKTTLVNLQPHYKDIIENAFVFAQNMLASMSSGLFFWVGVGLLLWSVFSIMNSVEHALNIVWSIKTKRSWRKKIFINFSTAMLFPFAMFASFAIMIAMRQGFVDALYQVHILKAAYIDQSLPLMFFLLNYMLLAVLFSVLYYIFPNQKMQYSSAFVGGLVAAALFLLAEKFYIQSQSSVSKHNAVFGAFSAIPMFLIWLFTSWMIILYGAYISYHTETYPSFTVLKEEKISLHHIKKLSLAIFRAIEEEGNKRTLRALHINEIAKYFIASHKQMDTALQYLLDAKLIKPYPYMPSTYCLAVLEDKHTDKEIIEKIEYLYADENVLVIEKQPSTIATRRKPKTATNAAKP